MTYTTHYTTDFTDAALQAAFRTYCGEEGRNVAGFIQFTTMDMGSWFFRAKCGYIREFWGRVDLRRQGHGTELLRLAEEWLHQQGCLRVLLTTDTAPDFYRKHGYTLETGIEARTRDIVYLKRL